ncbi:MAG: hypothetical protein AB9866_20865 [Syntrophobacteraceae bacterium]
MNRRYSAEGVEKAEHLYCYSGHSLRGVAELTGVPLTTLKRWSGKNGWVEKKSEIGRALIEIRTNTVLLRKRIIESVSIRYHEGPIRQQNGTIPVSCRYHSCTVKAAQNNQRIECGSRFAPSAGAPFEIFPN